MSMISGNRKTLFAHQVPNTEHLAQDAVSVQSVKIQLDATSDIKSLLTKGARSTETDTHQPRVSDRADQADEV
jgi:hypothetical protein